MARSLYVCYFGVREPLVQTQVIPYLRELAKGGNEILLVTFEADPAALSDYGVDRVASQLAGQGIEWWHLRYHKRLSAVATAWDILQGTLFVRRMIRGRRLDIVHGRSHVPTLMGALARKLSGRRPKLLFDIRGFFPEEYTEGGMWPEGGILFRAAKWAERWLLETSDGFVVLTEKAREIMFGDVAENGYDSRYRPVQVIPCCVDFARFDVDHDPRETVREELAVADRRVIAYVGSFGGNWYMPGELAELLAAAKRRWPETFALILSQTSPEHIEPLLHESGYSYEDYLILKVAPVEIPHYLSAADAGVSFIRSCYSKLASSPTKNAEYLAAGLPIIVNEGVGDTAEFTRSDDVGCVLREFNSAEYERVLDELGELVGEPDVRTRCRQSAKLRFDLERVGGERYRQLYLRLCN
jgi:glycosyltransferase involved in cell wall biosynthesis